MRELDKENDPLLVNGALAARSRSLNWIFGTTSTQQTNIHTKRVWTKD